MTPSRSTLPVREDQAVLDALAARIAKRTGPAEEAATTLPGLSLHCIARPTPLEPCLYEPSVTLVVAGQKRVNLGEASFLLTPGHFLLVSASLPVTPQILGASAERPFIALTLKLNMAILTTLMLSHHFPLTGKNAPDRAMTLGAATPDLMDAFRRLVTLLDSPRDLPALEPLVQQEILYRLLTSSQGERLQQMAAVGATVTASRGRSGG